MDEKVAKKLDAFFKQFKNLQYKKGQVLIRADDDPRGILYLTEGLVKKYAVSQKGDELIVNIFKPFSFFPMSWAINNTPNEYYYEASSNVNLWRAPKETVMEFIKKEPDILMDLLSRVYRGTDGMEKRMTNLMTGNAYTKTINELIISAKRFGKIEKDVAQIKISEKELASQSGMSRETISRELKILKNKDFITFSNHLLTIKNITKLEHELLNY